MGGKHGADPLPLSELSGPELVASRPCGQDVAQAVCVRWKCLLNSPLFISPPAVPGEVSCDPTL